MSELVIRPNVPLVAQVPLDMQYELAVGIDLLALAVALESQVHEDVGEDLVLLVKHVDLVADGALEFAIGHGLAGDLRERGEASLAAQLLAVLAFEHVQLDHHAGGALEILGELLQHVFGVEVSLD